MKVELSNWQTKVWDDDHRYKVINAGRRAGKTMLVTLKMVDYAASNPNTKVWYTAPTYRQAEQIVWEMIFDFLPQGLIAKKNANKLSIELKNKSKIELKGADDPDRLRGVGINLCIFDEVAFFNRWDEAWKIMRPTLADSKADCWFISTPNGINHFKYLADNYQPETDTKIFADKDVVYYHFTTYDNPYIDVVEIERMKAEMDEDSFAQEIMGEFRKMTGLVYKNFKRDIHMVKIPTDKFNSNWSYTRSLDFGFAHKTALIYFAISPDGTEIYGYDGIYQEGLTEREIADICLIKDAHKVITNPVADSAQPMSIQQLSQFGVHFNPIEKGPDSVKHGITKVSELLKIRKDTGKPTLMFNQDLPWIADEFEKYRWLERKTDGVIKEVPFKKDDDACFVAGTKILTSLGEKNIEDITDKDMIVTPFGLSKTTGSYFTGKKKVIDFGVFKSTPDHKILTNKGIMRVDTISYNHLVCQKQFTFKESLIDAILNHNTGHIDFIFKGLLTRNLEARQAFCIEKFGNITEVKYHKEWKYIILMAILPIIRLAILNLSLIVNMLKNITGVIGKVLKNIKRKLLKKQNSGEKKIQNKQAKFTQILLKRGGKIVGGKKWKKNVKFADQNIKLISPKEANIVLENAKQQPLEEKGVFNLATEHGMYYANGVLVSNCDAIRYFAMSYKDPSRKKRRKSRRLPLMYSTMGKLFR